MKTHIKYTFLMPVLLAALVLIPANRVTAQTFKTLYNFTGHRDGKNPLAGLIVSGNNLYGTAAGGDNSSHGSVFVVHTDGTGFTILHTFSATSDDYATNSDGASPQAGLILSGN